MIHATGIRKEREVRVRAEPGSVGSRPHTGARLGPRRASARPQRVLAARRRLQDRRARRRGRPSSASRRSGLTDHGVMNGSIELYKACKKHGIKPILGLEAYFVDDISVGRGPLRAQPPDAARRRTTRASATSSSSRSAGFLEGYKRGKANVDLGAARAPLEGRHRAHRLPPVALLPAPDRRRPGRGARARRRPGADLRRRQRLLRGPEERPRPIQDKANEGIVKIAREMGRPLVGTGRRPLPAPRGLRPPLGAALRPDQVDALANPKLTFDTNEFYLKDSDEMAQAFAEWPEAIAITLEIAERCNVEIELGRRLLPKFQTPDGRSRGRLPARAAPRRACAAATATRCRPRRSSGSRWSSASSRRWASTPTS